jgi:hypothetical protein
MSTHNNDKTVFMVARASAANIRLAANIKGHLKNDK